MAELALRLEKVAAWLAARTTILSVIMIVTAAALIAADSVWQLSQAFSPRWLRHMGKGLGEAAASIALFSLVYYAWREAFVRLMRSNAILPRVVTELFKYVLTILRLLHPLAGVMAGTLAVVHGYLLWGEWGSALTAAGTSGGAALLAIALLAAAGVLLRHRRQSDELRMRHRLIAFVFIALYAVHKVIAD